MRLPILFLLAFTVVLGAMTKPIAYAQGLSLRPVTVSSSMVAAQDKPGASLNVDINVNKGNGGGVRWYANPMWIAIGGLAAVLLIILIVMAGRGGGTTVVKG